MQIFSIEQDEIVSRPCPSRLPWDTNPYVLVNLYDMFRFRAEKFMGIVRKLDLVIHRISSSGNSQDNIADNIAETVLAALDQMKLDCQGLSLQFAIDKIDRIQRKLKTSTYEQIAQYFNDLSERLYDEIKDNLFMFLPKEKQKFFLVPSELFELDLAKFPSAKDEIEEAGKCYACGRNTACVLHLMRILEAGLNALAKHFGIPYEYSNWEPIINKIPGKIDEIEKLPQDKKPANWRDDRQFYSETGAHFRFLKDAFRNYAAHKHVLYDESRALSIFNHTSEFMRNLSTRLSE